MIFLRSIVVFITAILMISSCNSEEASDCPKGCKCMDQINSVIMRCVTLSIANQSHVPVSHFKIAYSDKPLSMKENVFSNIGLKGVNSITISNSSILNINKDAFSNLVQLTDVQITHTNITFIHPDTFQHNHNLKKFNFSNNPLNGIDSFIKSASVEELDMSNCNLTKIGPKTFINLSQLTLLDLSGNNIKKLTPGTFHALTNINEIRLSNNLITDLPKGTFDNEQLQSLILDNNPIEKFAWQESTDIDTLSLRSCKLQAIFENTFGNMPHMMNLDLSNNKIRKIDAGAFNKMPSLTTINLSGNQLRNVDDLLFANNLQLEKIILDNNHLMQLPLTGFKINKATAFNVFLFSCQKCGLKTLSEKTFHKMGAMVTLKLGHNAITDIRTDVFHHLTALNELDLSYNEISTIDDNTFKNNPNLNTLNLAGNPLKSLHPSIFKHNLNLKDIDLSNCGLYELWSSPKTEKLSSIQNLNVSNNRIQLINKEDVAVTDQLKSLDLSNNEITCTDSYKELIEYLTDKQIQDSQYITHEDMAHDVEGLTDVMVIWKEKAQKLCPNLVFESSKDIDSYENLENDDINVAIIDEAGNIDSVEDEDDDDSEEDDGEEETLSTNERIGWLNANTVEEDEFYLSSTHSMGARFMPLLVFIGTALIILAIAANIILFIVRRHQKITVPRINIRSVSKLKKNSGLVYQQLSEERDGTKTPILSRYIIPTVHQQTRGPEHV